MSTITEEVRNSAIEHLYQAIKDLEQGIQVYDDSASQEMKSALIHMEQ